MKLTFILLFFSTFCLAQNGGIEKYFGKNIESVDSLMKESSTLYKHKEVENKNVIFYETSDTISGLITRFYFDSLGMCNLIGFYTNMTDLASNLVFLHSQSCKADGNNRWVYQNKILIKYKEETKDKYPYQFTYSLINQK